MAEKTKANLILDFETGDTPDGSDFTNLIESQVNLAETTVQSMAGGLTAPSLGATSVSAANMKAGNIAVSGGVSAGSGQFSTLAVSGQATFANVSASAMNITGTVSAAIVVATSIQAQHVDVSGDVHIEGDLIVDGTFAPTQTEVGEVYIATTASVSASATPVEFLADITAESTFLVNFEASANRLVYKGAVTRSFLAVGVVGIESSQNNTGTTLYLAVNSSADGKTASDRTVGTDVGNMSTHGMVQLAPEDTVSMMVESDNAAAVEYSFHKAVLIVKS